MFISNAYAQTAATAGPAGFVQFLPLVLMFIIGWFLIIRPQMKRSKEHKQLLAAIAKGDEVVTQGGVAGRVTTVHADFVRVEIAPTVEIMVQKAAISAVLAKGTLKSIS